MAFSAEECYIYTGWRRNQTDLIVSGYEGVPQNLILNVTCWMLMIVAFSILRKKAWNYGRIALVERYEARWTEVFYGSTNFSFDTNLDPTGISDGNQNEHTRRQTVNPPRADHRVINLRSTSIDADAADTGLFSWIRISLMMSDQQFLRKSGPDAVQYLSYQRHLIFLASLMTMFSLLIITPIHLQGNAVRGGPTPDLSDFRQSTIQNLYSDSKLLWVHIILSIAFVFISILCMRHFSKGLYFVNRRGTLTLLINGVGTSSTHEALTGHFEETYPTSQLQEVNFAYDIAELQEIENSIEAAQRSYLYCRRYLEDHGIRLLITPHCCGSVCPCPLFLCSKSTDAIEFYSKAVEKYRQKSVTERQRILTMRKHLPIAFVTVKTVEMAEKIIVDCRLTAKCLHQTPKSKFSQMLKSNQWNVSFAPLPEDIIWENLSQGSKTWYFKLLLVNSILLLVTCFYSTPVFLLNALNVYLAVKRENESDDKAGVSGIIRDTIPTVLLWIAAVLIPSLVSVSDRMIGFWTKTAENRSKMIKIFTFLVFMVIILPSLGLTSFITLLGKPVQWDCIYSSTNVAFFVHYLTTSCFIGTASELMRFPELFVYMVRLCFTRSKAEIVAVRKASLWEFQLGSQYAWMMLNFAIFTLFSLVSPVITPFGLMYLIMKHFVDRYNIFFAYGPCKVDKQVHGTAINFVIVCMFLLQVILLAFVNSNSSQLVNKPLKAFAVIGLSITAALFVGQVFFNMCTNFSPILYHHQVICLLFMNFSFGITIPNVSIYRNVLKFDVIEQGGEQNGGNVVSRNPSAHSQDASQRQNLLPPLPQPSDEVDNNSVSPLQSRSQQAAITTKSGKYFAPILT